MKSRIILIAGAIFISILQLSAQLDTFDLSKYKLPDISRKQLDFNFSSQLRQTRDNTQQTKNLNAGGDLQTTLQTYVNNRKYQGSGSIQLSLNPDVSSQNDLSTNSSNKGTSFSSSINVNSTNRFFLKDLFFLETDFSGSASNQTMSSTVNSNDAAGNFLSRTDFDDANPAAQVSASILVGIGRIEPVEDARLAVYILQDLQKINKLVRIPTEEEILEFSSLISQLKNKRYFDYRLHKIEELKEVDRFLHEKGLVTENDISYFATINDNWDYSSGPSRSTGSKFYAGIIPLIYLSSYINHMDVYDSYMNVTHHKELDDSRKLKLSWLAGYEWNKPLKLYWQLQYGAAFVYTASNSATFMRVLSDTTKSRLNQLSSNEYINLGYYPNSRTYFSAGMSLIQSLYTNYNWVSTNNQWPKTFQSNNYSANLNLNFYYYLSPQLRLNGTWNLSSGLVSDRLASTKRNSFYQNLNLSLIYSIF